jgi:hypothetical protein
MCRLFAGTNFEFMFWRNSFFFIIILFESFHYFLSHVKKKPVSLYGHFTEVDEPLLFHQTKIRPFFESVIVVHWHTQGMHLYCLSFLLIVRWSL